MLALTSCRLPPWRSVQIDRDGECLYASIRAALQHIGHHQSIFTVRRLRHRGFMASGAKNQLPLVNVLGAPTVGDGSVGRWDGKERFFPDDFDAGGHL